MQVVLLAAGESSRFWPLNKRHKSLIRICGRSLIEWTVKALLENGIREEEIIIVQNPSRDVEAELKEKFPRINFVVQEEPKGMGNAVMQAKELINQSFLVMNPNHPDAGYFLKLLEEKRKESKASMVLFGKETNNPELYGIFEIEGSFARRIVEKPPKEKAPSNLRVVGVYYLPVEFFEYYRRVEEHQYAFEDALSLLMQDFDVPVALVEKEVHSLKYPWHLLAFLKELLGMKEEKVSESAKIARNAVVENSYVGENVRIMENAVVKNSYVGDGCVIGNNALVRDSSLDKNCIVGANCEVARSVLQEDVHTHSGFIGDSIIARGCRIGAGFITANVRLDRGEIFSVVKGNKVATGAKRFGCVVGEETKVGICVKTMPGVLIGNSCILGPGTVVFENVEDNTRFYTEFKSVRKRLA